MFLTKPTRQSFCLLGVKVHCWSVGVDHQVNPIRCDDMIMHQGPLWGLFFLMNKDDEFDAANRPEGLH